MAMLRGVFGPEMPYRDPHTARPALWALRHRGHDDLEASFAVVAGDAEPRTGLYRLRGHGRQGLVYVGEGVIVDRVRAHVAKMRAPSHAQGRVLALGAPLEISWVEGNWEHHKRLELENDLVAAHVLVEGRPPLAQFLG